MAKPIDELFATLTPEQQAQAVIGTEVLLEEMRLSELREQLGLSQSALAEILGVNQSSVSRVEKSSNTGLDKLRAHLGGLGARLEINAVFEDKKIQILCD